MIANRDDTGKIILDVRYIQSADAWQDMDGQTYTLEEWPFFTTYFPPSQLTDDNPEARLNMWETRKYYKQEMADPEDFANWMREEADELSNGDIDHLFQSRNFWHDECLDLREWVKELEALLEQKAGSKSILSIHESGSIPNEEA